MVALADVPYLRQRGVAAPAAGADWTYSCPGQGLQRIVALRALFTASAAVANRLPSLVLSDGTDDYAASTVGTAITAGLASPVTTWPGASSFGPAAGPLGIPAPTDGWLLLPGWSIRTVTAAIDVADQWSAIFLWVVEYPTGPVSRTTPDVYAFTEPKG